MGGPGPKQGGDDCLPWTIHCRAEPPGPWRDWLQVSPHQAQQRSQSTAQRRSEPPLNRRSRMPVTWQFQLGRQQLRSRATPSPGNPHLADCLQFLAPTMDPVGADPVVTGERETSGPGNRFAQPPCVWTAAASPGARPERAGLPAVATQASRKEKPVHNLEARYSKENSTSGSRSERWIHDFIKLAFTWLQISAFSSSCSFSLGGPAP